MRGMLPDLLNYFTLSSGFSLPLHSMFCIVETVALYVRIIDPYCHFNAILRELVTAVRDENCYAFDKLKKQSHSFRSCVCVCVCVCARARAHIYSMYSHKPRFKRRLMVYSSLVKVINLIRHSGKIIRRSSKDRLCDIVVRVAGYRSRGLGSIPGAIRFPE
jgi:hypothetical protein